ncbi:hypothetical protein [Arthrobacter sp. MYb224]|uniref:hypothetical protein n=1 Tax=Arthrobacter sp. MYb224 TaxID=1848600 RepID=UPI0015E4286C|nr:hypothetical protein [Arthrobacter sp. MYb224]
MKNILSQSVPWFVRREADLLIEWAGRAWVTEKFIHLCSGAKFVDGGPVAAKRQPGLRVLGPLFGRGEKPSVAPLPHIARCPIWQGAQLGAQRRWYEVRLVLDVHSPHSTFNATHVDDIADRSRVLGLADPAVLVGADERRVLLSFDVLFNVHTTTMM